MKKNLYSTPVLRRFTLRTENNFLTSYTGEGEGMLSDLDGPDDYDWDW